MTDSSADPEDRLRPDMTLLEVLSLCRRTEAVFRRYEAQAGVCLCCEALFDTLAEAAVKYRLDLDKLLGELQTMMATEAPPTA